MEKKHIITGITITFAFLLSPLMIKILILPAIGFLITTMLK